MPNLTESSSLENLSHVSLLLINAKLTEHKEICYARKCLT